MSLLSLSPSPLPHASASTPNPSADQNPQQSNLTTAYAAASSQGAGRPCTSCRLTVTLNANSVCNACLATKKVRAREGKRKRKSVPAPSAARKSLPMVSTDIGGIPKASVAAASSQTQTSNVNKKPKTHPSSSTTPIDCVYQTSNDLYSHLRRLKARHRRQFTGTYSIIADPKIRSYERVDRVFEALQDAGVLCSMKIGYSVEVKGLRGQQLCSCAQACGGSISVFVDDDNSHPFFSGQKITVEIKH
ncbi:hypothetical protein AB1N83_010744 [Pleurotus pulmonarius]|nr:hypothetical protein EYR38_009960 [Pleurotus pulmonarius]